MTTGCQCLEVVLAYAWAVDIPDTANKNWRGTVDGENGGTDTDTGTVDGAPVAVPYPVTAERLMANGAVGMAVSVRPHRAARGVLCCGWPDVVADDAGSLLFSGMKKGTSRGPLGYRLRLRFDMLPRDPMQNAKYRAAGHAVTLAQVVHADFPGRVVAPDGGDVRGCESVEVMLFPS